MTRVSWNDVGQRFYEAGTDRGVLYLAGQAGVPWNGLVGVNENSSGGEPKAYYLDGYKYLNVATSEEYAATINAFTSPREFDACDGTAAIQNGLFATQQPRKNFGFSYRTLVGNDVDGLNLGYKIHIVYNALASPAQRSYKTNGDSAAPLTLDWSITTLPPRLTGIRPTAHFIIDSRLTPPRLLESIENILYGSNTSDARLPTAEELSDLFTGLPPIAAVNWLTNGSFELSGSNVVVRKNLTPNPRMINSALFWAVYANATMTATSGGNQVTLTSTFTGLQSVFYHNYDLPTSSNLVYSSSIEVTVPTDGFATTFDLRTYGYGDNLVLSSSGFVTVNPGETVTIVSNSNGVNTTTSTTGIRMILYVNSGGPVGTKFVVRNALLEQASKVGAYFDGTNPPKRRRNAALQPQAKSTLGWVSNDGTRYLRSWDAEGGRRPGTGAALFTRLNATLTSVLVSSYGVGISNWNNPSTDWVKVVPGEQWTLSAYARSDVPFNTLLIVFFRDINGAAVGGSFTGPPTEDTAANTWARASHTVTVPNGAVYMAMMQNVNKAGSSIAIGGEKTWMTDALYEKTSVVNQFFDPTITPPAGFGYAWEAAATSSASYMYDSDLSVAWTSLVDSALSELIGVGIATYNSPTTVVRGIQSSRWIKSGSKSLRQIPFGSVRNSSYTEIASHSDPRGLVAGQTYTFVATFFQEAPQGFGDVSHAYRSLCIVNTTLIDYDKFAQARDIAGEQEVRLVFTIPPTGSWYLRMYNGGMFGDPSVWWDNAAIIDGVYQGEAFDGDTIDTDIRIYDWAGGRFLSPSTLRSWY